MRSTILTLHDPALAREYYASGIWRGDTLYGLAARHAAERPEAIAFEDSRQALSWRDLTSCADAVAADLHEAGVRPGQRVAVWSPNRVEMVVVLLACSRNGYVASLSYHANHTTAEVETLLRRIAVSALFVQPGHGADADKADIVAAIGGAPSLKRIYSLGDPEARPAGTHPFPARDRAVSGPPPVTNPDKVTYLAFTSGTTGQPKAVVHSDNTLLANGRAMVADWDLGPDLVIYCLGPLSHHLAIIGVELTLVTGCRYITNDTGKGQKPLDRIVATGADYVMGVPTHAIDIQQDMAARGLAKLGNVRAFYMSGSTIPVEVARRFLQMGITPQNTYGMTEGGSHTSTLRDDDIETMTGTVGQCCGRALPCYEIRIWRGDDRNVEAAPGEVGEIGGLGASLMLGYFGNQDSTEAAFNDHGYLMSGDLGRITERGDIEIVGRAKDLIIRGGHNIYPVEIENLAIRHPGIAKAAAFAVPDDRLGEKVCLAVIPVAGRQLEASEVLAHLDREGLSRYDMPEYFTRLDDMPLTPSGKVLKRQLVEDAKTGRLRPEAVRWSRAERPS